MSLPKPYYDHAGITIYNCDCREVLPYLDPVDLVLTDPPYGIGHKWDRQRGFGSCGGKLWDGKSGWDFETRQEEVNEALSLSRDAIVWGGNYYALPPSRGYLIWDKMQGQDFSLSDSEYAWVSSPLTPKTFRFARAQLASEGKVHPTQKPLKLMKWCLGFFPDAKTILDPFMGSGTTLVAAKLMGRKAIGIEIEEKYCEIAVRRLAQDCIPGMVGE